MKAEIGNWRHICVDMQRIFAEETAWQVAWMQIVCPQVMELSGRHPARTLFTRFRTPANPAEMPGQWKAYYEKWWMMTGEHMPAEMFDLLPPLKRLVPPARTFDKHTYSPWIDGRLHAALQRDGVHTLVVTGGETDVCVLATVLGGIDFGYRIVVLKDAVCSGADETHDASLTVLGDRFSVQMELMETEEFLSKVES